MDIVVNKINTFEYKLKERNDFPLLRQAAKGAKTIEIFLALGTKGAGGEIAKHVSITN